MKRIHGVWSVYIFGTWIESGTLDDAFDMYRNYKGNNYGRK
jgi:hypothetical protein